MPETVGVPNQSTRDYNQVECSKSIKLDNLTSEDRAVYRSGMQRRIEDRRGLRDEQNLLNKKLHDATADIDRYGRALYGDDYDPETTG